MASQFGEQLERGKAFVASRPDVFHNAVSPYDLIMGIAKLNPTLFNDINGAFQREIERNEDIGHWFQRTGKSYAFDKLLEGIPKPVEAPPPPTPTGPTEEEQIQAEVNKRTQSDLAKRLDQIYGTAKDVGIQNIEDQFIPARRKAISEEANLGRLRSPASIPILGRLDEAKAKSQGQLFGQLATQRAAGEVDLSKTIENILNNKYQFGEDLKLRRDTLGENVRQFNEGQALEREGLSLAERLGRIQADAKKPGTLDYLGTAFSGLSALGGLAGGLGAFKSGGKGR